MYNIQQEKLQIGTYVPNYNWPQTTIKKFKDVVINPEKNKQKLVKKIKEAAGYIKNKTFFQFAHL